MGEHGERDMSVPGVPGADLVVVEADVILGGSEAFLDRPARPGEVPPFFRTVSIRLSGNQPALLGYKAEAVVLGFDLLWCAVSEP